MTNLFNPHHRTAGSVMRLVNPRHDFGVSIKQNGGVIHRVRSAAIEWLRGVPVRMPIDFACTCDTLDGRLLREIPEGARYCATCPHPDWPEGGHVYVARCRTTGLIKVGHTGNLRTRMYSLGADLLASQPGLPADERRLLASAPRSPVQGREWFDPETAEIFTSLVHSQAVSAITVPEVVAS